MPSDDKAARFHALHRRGSPLILFNVWDAGGAKAAAKGGASAIATGSWSIAAANGYADGEKIPRDMHMDAIRRIARVTDLPVTADLESGFGADADAVAETIALSIEAGAIGCNLEDSDPADGSLRSVEEAAARISAARRAADDACPGYFINARTDVFFRDSAGPHDDSMIKEAIERARAYVAAGANGLFTPGLVNLALIRRLTAVLPVPLNIMRLGDGPSIAELAAADVARISHGPYPYILAMEAIERGTRETGGEARLRMARG